MINKYDRRGRKLANYRLLARDAFPLMASRTCGVAPDGDGWALVTTTEQWNVGSKNPLNFTIRARGARKQAAARMYAPVESMDDRQVSLPPDDFGVSVDLGRNEAEVRPNFALQGVRGTNFERGATYAGGARAVKDAMRKRREYDAAAPVARETAEELRQRKIVELEEKIRQLMGLVGK